MSFLEFSLTGYNCRINQYNLPPGMLHALSVVYLMYTYIKGEYIGVFYCKIYVIRNHTYIINEETYRSYPVDHNVLSRILLEFTSSMPSLFNVTYRTMINSDIWIYLIKYMQ